MLMLTLFPASLSLPPRTLMLIEFTVGNFRSFREPATLSLVAADLPGGNHRQLLDSIRDKVLPLGDDVGFICGHGPGSRIGDERRENPFLREI